MARLPRPKLGDVKRARKEKKGLKRTPRFPQPNIVEDAIYRKVIYRNPKAITVRRSRGKKTPFTMKNVEWISIVSKIGAGGYGTVYWGKAKFKGKTAPVKVAIKHIGIPKFLSPDYPEIISRLRNSKANHPRTEYLEISGIGRYLIQEAFLGIKGKKLKSKFGENRLNLVRHTILNLSQKPDAKLFEQMATQAALLAKSGLYIHRAESCLLGPTIDVFSAMQLKFSSTVPGDLKLYVQDIDMLTPENNPNKAWKYSARNLVETISESRPENFRLGNAILAKVGKKMKLKR